MDPYYNLPSHQEAGQRLIDQFNAAERLWESLEWKRRLRRAIHPKLSKKKQQSFDLLDFERAQPFKEYFARTFL